MKLVDRKCVPCDGNSQPLFRTEAENLLKDVPTWLLSDNGKAIHKTFSFSDFAEALAFVNRVGDLAEREGHHPDIQLSWGKVSITFTTHAISGLSLNDFVLAAKIDTL